MVELNSFLKGIADAIRSKKGTNDKINARNFASEIESISCGGSSVNGIIEVDTLPTENIDTNTFYKTRKEFLNVYLYASEDEKFLLTDLGMLIAGCEKVETKPTTNIIESGEAGFYLYYVTNENEIFMYLNMGSGADWFSLGSLLEMAMEIQLTFMGEVEENNINVTNAGYYAYMVEGSYYKYDNKWVRYRYNAKEIEVKSTQDTVEISPNSPNDYFSKVTINAITSADIDGLRPENIIKGVSILDIYGTAMTIGNFYSTSPYIPFEELTITNSIHLNENAFEGKYIKKISIELGGQVVGDDHYNALPVCCFKNCDANTIKLKGEYYPKFHFYKTQGYLESGELGVYWVQSSCFSGCKKLTKLVLDFPEFKAIVNTTPITNLVQNIFYNTPIASGTGYIYVPDTLVDTVKALEGWSLYASQIKPISEYVE